MLAHVVHEVEGAGTGSLFFLNPEYVLAAMGMFVLGALLYWFTEVREEEGELKGAGSVANHLGIIIMFAGVAALAGLMVNSGLTGYESWSGRTYRPWYLAVPWIGPLFLMGVHALTVSLTTGMNIKGNKLVAGLLAIVNLAGVACGLFGLVWLVFFVGASKLVDTGAEGYQQAVEWVGGLEGEKSVPKKKRPTNLRGWRWLANQGDAEAQFEVGRHYFLGRETGKSIQSAREYWEQSAKQGYGKAAFALGHLLDHGLEGGQDRVAAAAWYRKAGKDGIWAACARLGEIYLHGEGLEFDREEAMKWLELAANGGDRSSQYTLGMIHLEGRGVAKDFAMAANLLQRAGSQGHLEAIVLLGKMHAKGEGVKQDWETATNWHLIAAEQGHVPSQVQVGDAYLRGLGVTIDLVRSLAWYNLAAEKGSFDGRKKKNLMLEGLSAEIVNQAKSLAQEIEAGLVEPAGELDPDQVIAKL